MGQIKKMVKEERPYRHDGKIVNGKNLYSVYYYYLQRCLWLHMINITWIGIILGNPI